MKLIEKALNGILLLEPRIFEDERGYFLETYNAAKLQAFGIDHGFVQDNISRSRHATMRGMHYQLAPDCQAKLVSVVAGRIFDAVVDIREGSPSFGEWAGFELSAENRRSLYVPEGFAHGFVVLSDWADVIYKCSRPYAPGSSRVFRWDDPEVGIDWPIQASVFSRADAEAPLFRAAERNFTFRG